MVSSFNMLEGVMQLIVSFINVGACAKRNFFAISCCYQKSISMKRYILKDTKSIYGISFDLYISKRFKIGLNGGEHTDDISTRN